MSVDRCLLYTVYRRSQPPYANCKSFLQDFRRLV